MKLVNAKLAKALATILFTITASASIQAVEVIEVEPINKVEFSNLLQLDLAQSVKSMQVKAVAIKSSAETLLVAQNVKLINGKEITINKLSLVSE